MGSARQALCRDRRRPPAQPVRRRPEPGRDIRRGSRRALSRLFQEQGHRPDGGFVDGPCRAGATARADRGDVHGTADQHDRAQSRAPCRVARSRGRRRRSGRRERRSPGSRRARADVGVRGQGPFRRLDRSYRQTHPDCRQHRDRRFGSRAGHGIRGSGGLLRPVDTVSFRIECGRHRHLGGDRRPRPGRDVVRRVVQDLHDPGDARERPHRAGLGGRRDSVRTRFRFISWQSRRTRKK